MKLFKKKQEVVAEIPAKEPEKRVSYLDVARKLGKRVDYSGDAQKVFDRAIQRKADSYVAVNKKGEKVAMDEMIKPTIF